MATVTNNAEIHVKVVGAESAKAQIGGIGAGLKNLAVTAVGIIGGLQVGRLLGKTIKDAYLATEKQNLAIRKLDNTLNSTGKSAIFASEELQKLASEIQKTSNFGDEDVLINLTTGLLRYSSISKTEFPRVQRLIADVAAETGDLAGSTKLLGLAMDDPVMGMSRLKRTGVALSETQQALIRQYVESGEKIKAQGVLMDALEEKYKGNARAMQTVTALLKNSWGDYLEYLGSATRPVISGLQSGFAFAINQMIKDTKAFTASQIEASIESERAWSKFTGRFMVILNIIKDGIGNVAVTIGELGVAYAKFFLSLRQLDITHPVKSFNAVKDAAAGIGDTFKNVGGFWADWFNTGVNQMSDLEWEANKFYNDRIKLMHKLKAESNALTDVAGGSGIVSEDQIKAMEDYAKALQDLTLDIANYSKQTLDAQSSGNAMFDALNAGFKEWADLRARIKDLFGDTAEANPFIAPVDEAFIASNIEIYTKYYQDNLNLIKESVMSETDLIEAEYTKRIADFDSYAEIAKTALQGLLTYQILTEQEYNAKLAELSALGVQVLDKANQDKLKKLAEYNAKHESVIEEAAIKELSAMEELGQDIKNMVVNGFAGAFADAIVEGENFAKSMQQLFKDLVRMILAELAKLAILGLFKSILGVATGGLSTGASAGPLGDFFSSGGYASIGKNPLGMASNPSYMNPSINMSSTDARIDRLARIVEQNRPIVYTQVIEGVPFHNAVKRAEMQALVM